MQCNGYSISLGTPFSRQVYDGAKFERVKALNILINFKATNLPIPGGQSMDSQILLPFKVSIRLLFLPDFKFNV